VLCASGTIVRIGVKFAAGGSATFPGVGAPTLSQTGWAGVGGGLRYCQVWCRDAIAYCASVTNNLSNGVSLVQLPRVGGAGVGSTAVVSRRAAEFTRRIGSTRSAVLHRFEDLSRFSLEQAHFTVWRSSGRSQR